MPRDSNGTYTLPAGNPVVSGEDITSAWANSTLTDIASAITGSLSRTGQGGMQSTLLFGDGTVSAPGIAWTQEPGTGFYRAGANDMRVAVAGDGDVMRWFEDTVYIRNAADSAWAPILYEGGAGTVPDGTSVNTALEWNDTDGAWEAVPPADVSNVEDGSSDGQSVYWDDTDGIYKATGILTLDPTDGVATIGSGMVAASTHRLSVLDSLWMGNEAGTAGINLMNVSDTSMVIAAGTRAASTTGSLPLTITGSAMTLNAASSSMLLQTGGLTGITIASDRRIGIGSATAGGTRVNMVGVSGDTTILRVVNSAGTDILLVREDGNIRMPNLPTSAAGLPAGTLWYDTGSSEVRVA